MALLPQVVVTMVGLAIIGLTYGGTISVYPAFISKTFGAAAGTIIYGRVFTAWAAAGLPGPGLAGLLYDRFENYSLALIVAAVIASLSLAVPKWIPPGPIIVTLARSMTQCGGHGLKR